MTSLRSAGLAWFAVVLGGCAMEVGDDTGAAAAALHGSCDGSCERSGPRLPLIFDTDMDFDDAAALAYLCQQHKTGEIDLRAVTVTNNGVGMPGHAIRHARCILAECGLSHIPVADGSDVGVNPAPAELLFAIDAVLSGTFAECTESTEPSEISAAELLVQTIRDSRRPVVLLSTGPLSNVAAALALDGATHPRHRRGPPIARRVRAMYVMGGAVGVPGNLFGSALEGFDNSQELNMWVDPAAAQEAFDALGPSSVQLVPLDATNHVPVAAEFIETLRANQETPEARLVLRIMDQPIVQFGISLGAFYWWDPLAAVAAAGDLCAMDFERDRIDVVQGGPQAGRTISTPHGVRMHVATSADRARFEQIFLDGLNGY